MTVPLPDGLLALLRRPSPCYVATVMPDGSPQLTQTWVTTDGEHVVTTDEDPVAREDRAFVDALRGDPAGPPVPYAEALRTHAVVCAADRSAQLGGDTVRVDDLLGAW